MGNIENPYIYLCSPDKEGSLWDKIKYFLKITKNKKLPLHSRRFFGEPEVPWNVAATLFTELNRIELYRTDDLIGTINHEFMHVILSRIGEEKASNMLDIPNADKFLRWR